MKLHTRQLKMMLALFGVGVAIALSHMAISIEISVTLSYHTSLVRSLILMPRSI